MSFFCSLIRELLDKGNQVDIATNENEGSTSVNSCYREWGCRIYPLSCTRSPIDKGNAIAIREIRTLVEENDYDVVHCHTPTAAVCTRLACASLRKKRGKKVYYTAHGFHFFTGAPLRNWLVYYPIEWFCSWKTDLLITINNEDYCRAKKRLHAKKVEYVPGVGIDIGKFATCSTDRLTKRAEIGIPEDAFLLISVGELSVRKNHRVVIEALNKINDSKVYYIVVGTGDLLHSLEAIDKTGRVKFLGYRDDISDLLHCADLYLFPSLQEGLPVALMEAMASGIPCIASKIRGNTDLMNAFSDRLIDPTDNDAWERAISAFLNGNQSSDEDEIKHIESFSMEIVNEKMMRFYFEE